jgi:riboflavin biosynthesis pyrimidine reductase
VAAPRSYPAATSGGSTSIELARSLLGAGLIDEFRLVVAPTVAGRGRRLFDADSDHKLELIDVKGSPGGNVFLVYRQSTLVT